MSTYPYTCGDLSPVLGGWGFRPSAVEVERVTAVRVKPGDSRTGRQDAAVGVGFVSGAFDYGNAPAESDDLWAVIDLDPTVTLTKAVIVVPILEAGIGYEAREGTPDEWVNAVRESFDPFWDEYLRESTAAVISHGRKSFEPVFGARDGRTVLTDLKPLDHRLVTPMVLKGSGAFAGLRTTGADGKQIDLLPPYALHVTSDACNRNPFGASWYRPARQTWWEKVNDLRELAKIGQKASGRQAKGYYPPGATPEETERNKAALQTAVDAYMRGDGILLPNTTAGLTNDLAADYRNIKGAAEAALYSVVLEDFGNTAPATMACLEKIKARNTDLSRALKAPERASQTGSSGTNAESATQSQVNLAVSQLLMNSLVAQAKPVIDALLVSRFGERARGAVWGKAGKIRDQYAEADNKVLDALLANADTLDVLAEEVDVDAILDRRGVPKLKGVLDFAKALKAKREQNAPQPQAPGQQADPNADPFAGLGLNRADGHAVDRLADRFMDRLAGPFVD